MITKDSRIVLGGDSWGCGEYDHVPDHRITHRGIEQYFLDDGYSNFQNTSEGASSNAQSVLRLKAAIDKAIPELVIWFQTDPIRDLRPYDNYVIKSYQQLVDDHYNLIKSAYENLNNIGVEIYCIGGVSKLNLELMQNYKNLKPLIPSAIEFLIPVQHPVFWCTDWAHTFDPNLDRTSTNLIYELFDNPPLELAKNYPEYFKPDNHHPNRYGHRKMYEYIINKFTGDI